MNLSRILNIEPASGNLLLHLPSSELTNNVKPLAETRTPPDNRCDFSNERHGTSSSNAVIAKIEAIFESLHDCILDKKKELVLELKTRRRRQDEKRDPINGTILNAPNYDTRRIRFPSLSPQEAWKFTAVLRILELSHEALVTGSITTKRDIYYRDPELFVKQGFVDRYVDDLAYTLGEQRDALNVVAAAKGLVVGFFSSRRNNESYITYDSEPEGLPVPSIKDICSLHMEHVRWILVVEKEATFRTLAKSQYWKLSSAGKGVMVTAKGYPDIRTRQFLNFLSRQAPHIPMFALVDHDPDGISIMSTYKYGSTALSHETNLAVPSLRWLGVKSDDIIKNQNRNGFNDSVLRGNLPYRISVNKEDLNGLLRLKSRDRRIAVQMLRKNLFAEDGRELEWRRELQIMLMLGVKAEIQILSERDNLENWLDEKLCEVLGFEGDCLMGNG